MTTLAVDRDTRDTLAHVEDQLIAFLSASLASHTSTPVRALWSIEEAVRAWHGLGLTFDECDGSCGRYVWGASEARRLVLCDECAAEAHEAGESLLLNRRGAERAAAHVAARLSDRMAKAKHGQESEPLTVTRYTGHGLGHTYRDDVPLGAS